MGRPPRWPQARRGAGSLAVTLLGRALQRAVMLWLRPENVKVTLRTVKETEAEEAGKEAVATAQV